MKTIAFLAPVTLGHGRHAVRLHHEWLQLPAENAAELKRTHPRDVVDVTPTPIAAAIGIRQPRRMTSLHIVDCLACAGQAPRMTACPQCRGATKLMAL